MWLCGRTFGELCRRLFRLRRRWLQRLFGWFFSRLVSGNRLYGLVHVDPGARHKRRATVLAVQHTFRIIKATNRAVLVFLFAGRLFGHVIVQIDNGIG